MSEAVESKKDAGWIDLPDGGGGKYRRDPKNWKRGWYYCPDCKKERPVRSIPSDGSECLRQRTGLCQECSHKRKRKYPEPFTHQSGAECFLYDRDPSRPDTHARFVCANYDPATHSPDKTYTKLTSLYDPDWKGRCSNCISKWRRQKRSIADLPVRAWSNNPEGPDGPHIADILFSQKAPEGKVFVYYYQCKHRVPLTRGSVLGTLSAHSTKRRHFPLRCRDCFYRPDRLFEQLRAAEASNGNGQKNGGLGKKHPGPAKGSNARITEETVRDAFNSLGRYAPQERIAEKIGVDPRSLRDWHRAQGLSYQQLRELFTDTGGS